MLVKIKQGLGCSRRRNPEQGQPLSQQKPESTLIRLMDHPNISGYLGEYVDVVSCQDLIPTTRLAQATKQYEKLSKLSRIDPRLTIAHSTDAFDLLTTREGKLVLRSKEKLEVTFNEPEISASPIRVSLITGKSIYFNEGTTVKYYKPEATLIRTIKTQFGHIIIEDSTPQATIEDSLPHNALPQTTTTTTTTNAPQNTTQTTNSSVRESFVALSFIPIIRRNGS